MVALQIRDVPDDVRRALVARARARGQSLQAFLLWLVEEEARRGRNLALLDRFAERADGSTLTPDAAGDAVREARVDRDQELDERSGTGGAG